MSARPNPAVILSNTGFEPTADKDARIAELRAEGRRGDPSSWTVTQQQVDGETRFYVERRWEDKVYMHPIGFDKEIEATRAAARLNARDAA